MVPTTRRTLIWTPVLCVLACCIQFGYGQLATTTSTLSGVITDPSGAVLPKASVNLLSSEMGVSRSFSSDHTGHYTFSQLPPGAYTLTVQMKGFKEYKQFGIVLSAAQSATQDVSLAVGSEVESVVVTAGASVLNEDNANISADVDSEQIVDMPLNMRNIYGLMTMNSSVNNTSQRQQLFSGNSANTDSADQDISFVNFAGGFQGSTAYLLDGNWDQDPYWGGVMYVPSVDSVDQFKIQNNSFTAQYGWSTGNVVNVTTKAGTNNFHGDAFGFFRNAALDANLWFSNHNNQPRLDFSRTQAGVAAGGPLYIPKWHTRRDKTFIFGVYEHLSLSTPSNNQYWVPGTQALAGNFGALLGPQNGTDAEGRPIYPGQIYDPRSAHAIVAGQIDPTTGLTATKTGWIRNPIKNNDLTTLGSMDPVAQKILSYYPKPDPNSTVTSAYNALATAPAHSNEYSVRVDHNINENTRAYFRYSYKEEIKVGEPSYYGSNDPAGPGNLRPNNRWNFAFGYSDVFSPTLTMNLSAGAQLWHETSTNQSLGFKPSSLGLPSYLDAHSPVFPVVQVGGVAPLGPQSGENVMNHGPIGSASADFIKLAGRHTVNFGFMGLELKDYQKTTQLTYLQFPGGFSEGPDPNNLPNFSTGSGLAELMLGLLGGGNTGIAYNPSVESRNYGWYIQDDWKPIRHLVLNLGFRYELQDPPKYHANQGSVFNPDVVNPISFAAGQQYNGALQFLSKANPDSYNTNYKNFAPRFGFSYRATPTLNFRGGYGIFYPESISCCFMVQGDGFSSSTPIPGSLNVYNPNPTVSLASPWPNGYIPITGNANGDMQQVGYSVNSNFRQRAPGYVQQYMFGVEKAITKGDMIEVDYVGNHGINMIYSNLFRSQLDPKYFSMGAATLNSQVSNPFYGHIASGASGCGLDQQTVPQFRLLQPYPQYCGVGEQDAPVGFSRYNSLQAAYTHKWSSWGWALVSYTYSKFLDNIEGASQWAYAGNSGPANTYNMAADKSVDGNDIPHSLVANYLYQVPFGRGRKYQQHMNRAMEAVAGGWQISGSSTFKAGLPLSIQGANYYSYGGNLRPDVVSGTNLHVARPSIKEWFNTGAFTYAQWGTFGTAPRYFSNLRGPGYQNWDMAVMKVWQWAETQRIQFRMEAFNAFNHPQFYTPSTSYGGCDPNGAAGGCSPGFGQISQAFASREVQAGAKFYW